MTDWLLRLARKGWSRRIANYYRDFWSDFWATVREVSAHRTTAQLCGIIAVVNFYFLFAVSIWVLLSIPLGVGIWIAWNETLAPLKLMPEITPTQGIFLAWLANLLTFRKIEINALLPERKGRKKYDED